MLEISIDIEYKENLVVLFKKKTEFVVEYKENLMVRFKKKI